MAIDIGAFDRDGWRLLRLGPRGDVTVTDLGDEIVLLDPGNQEMYALDLAGAFIWRSLTGATLAIVSAALAERFELDPDVADRDLHDLVQELNTANLLRVVPEDTPGA